MRKISHIILWGYPIANIAVLFVLGNIDFMLLYHPLYFDTVLVMSIIALAGYWTALIRTKSKKMGLPLVASVSIGLTPWSIYQFLVMVCP